MTSARLLATLATLLLVGCNTPDIPSELAAVYVEAPNSASNSSRQELKLPVSGIVIPVLVRPLVLAEEILNTTPITSGESDLRQEFLLVQIDRRSATDVMNYTKEAIGRHFILVINDSAVGIMPIDAVITDGNLIFHVEKKGMSNTEAVMDISKRLNISALKLRKIMEAEKSR